MKAIPNDLKQDNIITAAKYDYSLWEKRIVYQVIYHIQKDIAQGGSSRTLFENLVLKFSIKDVLKDDSKNHYYVKKAAKSLRQKSFEVELENGDWLECGFINYTKIITGTGMIEVEVSKQILPYLYELASNFTAYSLVVAMSLKSVYSQRFYEFCSRYKDSGWWKVSVDDLREMLKLEMKYESWKDFKRNVIDVACKELEELYERGEADVCFTYEEKKTGRQVTGLHFKIKWVKKNKGAEESTADDILLINEYLTIFWPESETRREQVFNAISDAKAFLEFRKKADEICQSYQGRRPSELGGILTTALREDLGLKV
jgi:plasmid replication initiation protein